MHLCAKFSYVLRCIWTTGGGTPRLPPSPLDLPLIIRHKMSVNVKVINGKKSWKIKLHNKRNHPNLVPKDDQFVSNTGHYSFKILSKSIHRFDIFCTQTDRQTDHQKCNLYSGGKYS